MPQYIDPLPNPLRECAVPHSGRQRSPVDPRERRT